MVTSRDGWALYLDALCVVYNGPTPNEAKFLREVVECGDPSWRFSPDLPNRAWERRVETPQRRIRTFLNREDVQSVGLSQHRQIMPNRPNHRNYAEEGWSKAWGVAYRLVRREMKELE